jgi:hypothetical protein
MATDMLMIRPQVLRLIHGWGYCEGNLPKRHEPEVTLSIPLEIRSGPFTRAIVTWDATNGAKQRLYRVTWID